MTSMTITSVSRYFQTVHEQDLTVLSRLVMKLCFLAMALPIAGSACARGSVEGALIATAYELPAIDSIVDASREEFRLSAVSLVIMHGKDILLAKGYGLADRGAGVSATDSTIYPIGSLSKQVTAAAVMKLVEAGRVRLSDPLAQYFPDLRIARDSSLKIEDLLRQTSGIESWDDYPELRGIESASDSVQFPLSRIVRLIGAHAPLYPSGSWWSYSNSNYTLLAALVERVSGVTYDQYVDREFFTPLGLRSTASCAYQPIQLGDRRRAVGYEVVGDTPSVQAIPPALAPGMTGAGGLCSSARDIAVWMRALVDGKTLSARSFEQMTALKPVSAGFTPPYGFGLSLRPLFDEPTVWHQGVMAGYTSALAYFPRRDLIIAVITNGRHAPIDELLRRITRKLTSTSAPTLRDLPLPANEATRTAGSYDDGMFKFRIVAESGALFFYGPFGPPERMLYQGRHDFANGGRNSLRFSFQPDTGAVRWVAWDWGTFRAFGARIP